MKQLFDLFPVVVFFAVFYGTGQDIIQATGATMVASALQVAAGWALWRRVDRMHLAVFGVLLVFGGLTIFLHDETFIKWKPSIIDVIIASVLFGGQFVGSRNLVQRGAEAALEKIAPGARFEAPGATWILVNAAAILFFLSCAAINLYVAYHFDTATWVNMKTFGFTILNFLFMLVLFAWLWRHVRQPDDTDPVTDHPPDEPNPRG